MVFRLNNALLSQLEVACSRSLTLLMRKVEQYYAVLPCARLPAEAGRFLSPEFLQQRAHYRSVLGLPEENYSLGLYAPASGMDYSMRIVRVLIQHISSLIDSNLLFKEFAPCDPKPIFRILIASKRAGQSPVRTKRAKTPPVDPDSLLPRVIRDGAKPTKREVLVDKGKSTLLYSLLENEEMCVDDPWGFHELKPAELLAEDRLGWASVGRDQNPLQLLPDIATCEKELIRIIHFPLLSLAQVPQVTAAGSVPVRLENFSGELQDAFTGLRDLLQVSLYGPIAMVAILRQFSYLVQPRQSDELKKLIDAHIGDYAGLGKEMRKVREHLKLIAERFPARMQFGLVEADLHIAKSEMLRNGNQLLQNLLQELTWECIGLLNHALQLFIKIKDDLRRVPKTVEELKVVSDYLDTRQDEVQFSSIQTNIAHTNTILALFREFQCELDPLQEQKFWETKMWAGELKHLRARAIVKLQHARPAFIDQVTEDAADLLQRAQTLKSRFAEFEEYRDVENAKEYAAGAKQLVESLHSAVTHAKVVNSREGVLRMPLTDYSDLETLERDFQKFNRLWTFVSRWTSAWTEWNHRSFRSVDPAAVKEQYNQGVELLTELEAQFQAHPLPLEVVKSLQDEMRRFQGLVHIILQLRQPAIHERHIDLLLETLGIPARADTVSLLDLASGGVLGHQDTIDRICHDARNEYEIELVLHTAESEISSFELTLQEDEDFPGLSSLLGLRKAEEMVQELQVTLSFLSASSKYVGYFRQKIEKLAVSLTISLQVIRDIAEFQERWTRIYPLLQLPEVAAAVKYNSETVEDLQSFFSRQVLLVHSTQSLTVASDAKIKNFVEAIEKCETLSKKIKKIVSEKCDTFGRLLLLSQKEMMRFFASVARGREVKLSLLFPGIEPVPLGPELREVHHGPTAIALRPPIALNAYGVKVKPELWLQTLESTLRRSFQSLVVEVCAALEQQQDWWKLCPDAQVLAVAEQVFFSKLVCVEDYRETAVKDAIGRLKADLADLIGELTPVFGTTDKKALVMFKKPNDTSDKHAARGRLEKLTLQILNQLHLLHTAQRTEQFRPDDFLWRCFFRLTLQQGSAVELTVTYFDSVQHFGFEWAPLPLPLFVATPAADRCLLNLATALKNGTSALLQGKGGSSKTATLKELAFLHGRMLLIWRVSPAAHSSSVLQALSGSLTTGAWMCFEEVDLLDPLLLNSLSHYLAKVRDALKAVGSKVEIEGRGVVANANFAFWGMTTTHNLRLPACVEDCFRVVAMSKPDIAVIAEVRLYALGFTKSAGDIGKKIARTLSFWEDDCSSVARVALARQRRVGNLRVANLVIDTMTRMLDSFMFADLNYLVNNACRKVLGVGLPGQEVVLLDEFLTTVFHSTCNDTVIGTLVHQETQLFLSTLEAKGCSSGEEVMRKLHHIRICLMDTDRKLILVAGPAGAGKTTLMKTALDVHAQLTEACFSVPVLSGQVSMTHMYRLIQACVSRVDSAQFQHIAMMLQPRFSPRDMVYLDTETLSLDSLLAVARGEIFLHKELRIEVPQSLRVIAEIETLEDVSPDLLSESCLIYCGDEVVPDTDLFQSAIAGFCPEYTIPRAIELFAKYFLQAFGLFEGAKPAIHIPRKNAVFSLANWMNMLLGPPTLQVARLTSLKLETKSQYKAVSIAERQELLQHTEVEAAWVLALTGSLANVVEDKRRFNQFLLEMCRRERDDFASNLAAAIDPEDDLAVFRVNYSFAGRCWERWPSQLSDVRPESLIIPSESTVRLHHWVQRVITMRKHVLVIGPHQSGKTLVLEEVLRTRVADDFASVIPLHILYGTTCDAVQYEVERMMDQYRPKQFGALGGRHHYVFLEDMNQDTMQIYDLIRFLLENRGWYKRDVYSTISDSTFCLGHSYSPHKFRKPNFRALRHFLVIFKEDYSQDEVRTLFSVVDPGFRSTFLHLYGELQASVVQFEGTWYHSTLSNLMPALTYIQRARRWPAMIRRYFAFLNTEEARDPAFFVPKATVADCQAESHYVQVDTDNFPNLLATFEKLTRKCTVKYPDAMKAVRRSLLHQDTRLAMQLYHFSQFADDLLLKQHSIVATRRDLASLQAVILMAAELTSFRVVEITLFDITSELANSMAEREGNYLPTEVKFAIKQMVDSALRGEKSLCVVGIEDESNITSPIFRSFMEVCCDIVLGKSLKSYSITRKAHKQYHDLYPDQVLQLQRDLIQSNIVFSFLVRTRLSDFSRSGWIGPMETLKHTYRALFNHCRVTVYEDQTIPTDLVKLTTRVFDAAESSDLSLFESFAAAVNRPLDDFVWEKVSYLAAAMRSWEDTEIDTELAVLLAALGRLGQFEQELEKSDYLVELHTRIEALRKVTQTARKELFDSAKVDLSPAIEAEKKAAAQGMEARTKKLQQAVLTFFDTWQPGTKPNLYLLILLGGLQRLVVKVEEPFPIFDPALYLGFCKPILDLMDANQIEVMRRLQALDLRSLPVMSEFLDEVRGSPGAQLPLHTLLSAIEDLRTASADLALKEQLWSEGKLSNPHEEAKLKEEREAMEAKARELKEAEERLQISLTLRQKLLRFLIDLKPSQREWSERVKFLSGQQQFTKGNSLLHASVYVLALSEDKESQDSLRSTIRGVLSSHGLQCSPSPEVVDHGVVSSAFLQHSVEACEWIWKLTLPYPVFIDPVGAAGELIREPGLVVVKYAVDTRLDTSLENCIESGKPLLVVEPTEGMLMWLTPLMRWRHSRSIEAAKGEALRGDPVALGRKRVKVHKDFRLYICLATRPSDILARVSTVISLESSDAGSWRDGMMIQLFKTAHVEFSHSRVVKDTVVNFEVVKALAAMTQESVYTSQSIRNLLKMGQKLAVVKQKANDSFASDEESQTSLLQQTYSKLLDVANELGRILQLLRFGRWTIPPQMFQRLLLLSCNEQIAEVGFPTEAQIHLFQEPILYRFLVKLLWTLPAKHQSALLLSYCVLKSTDHARAVQTVELMVRGLLQEYTTAEQDLKERAEELREKWASYPSTLEPGSKEFRRFISRDIFVDAVLPEMFDACTQCLLVSWLRPDLLPLLSKSLPSHVLGRRFSYLPSACLPLVAEFVSPALPIAVMYKRRDPRLAIKQTARLAKVSVTHLVPQAAKKAHFLSESKVQQVLKTLCAVCTRSEWLVLEGFESLEKSQVEQLFIQAMEVLKGDEVCKDFRLWFVFRQSAERLPSWDIVMKNCFRVCYRETETVRERLVMMHELQDMELFESFTNDTRVTYAKHCQVEMGFARKATRKATRFNSLAKLIMPRPAKGDVTAPSPAVGRRSLGFPVPNIDPAMAAQAVHNFFTFNLTFVSAALELRQRFDAEMAIHLSWKEVQTSLQDSISSFSLLAEANVREAGKQSSLLFLLLLGSSWGEMSFFAALNLAKYAVISNSPALKFMCTSAGGDWVTIQYPLFQINAPTKFENVVLDMPKQDHLYLVGLPNRLNRFHHYRSSLKVTKAVCGLSPLGDSLLPSRQLSSTQTLSLYLEKLTQLSSIVPITPVADFADCYEKISHERIRGFSYFFVQDRYRAQDFQMKVLSQVPKWETILETLERENDLRFAEFVKALRDQCDRLLGFLQYRTAQVSAHDSKILRKLQKLRVPHLWARKGPYSLRHVQSSTSYLAQLARPVFSRGGVIQLREVHNPAVLLTTVLRAMVLVAGADFAHAEMEMAEYSGEAPLDSVLVDGLAVYNAELKGPLLKDAGSEEPWRLPVCSISLVLNPPESIICSQGVLVYYRAASLDRGKVDSSDDHELTSMVQCAFNYQETKWIEQQSAPPAASSRVLCPLLRGSSATRFWAVFDSDKPQHHWSKRDVHVDLP